MQGKLEPPRCLKALLEEACKAVRDRSEIIKELHLNFLEELLIQAVGGDPASTVDEDIHVRMRNFQQYRDWRFRLYTLISGAQHCQNLFDQDLVSARERITIPGLRDLVGSLAAIWQSLTGRPASVEKVHSREGETPDFVMFVQGVVTLAPETTVPTFSQVQTATKPRNKRGNPTA